MANARKILIVDDDTDLRDTLVEQLSLHEEFEASAVDTGAKGASAAKANAPDLVLMDVGLPDMDGREAVKLLRKGGFKAPIIMLTGHDTEFRHDLGPRGRRQRLRHQALPLRRAARPHPGPAPPARAERGRGLLDRPLHLPAEREDADRRPSPKVRLTEKETAILKLPLPGRPEGGHRATSCSTRSGATIPASPPTRSKPTSIASARRSRRTPSKAEILVTEVGGYKLVP